MTTLWSKTKALRGKQAANSLIIFFKEGMAHAQSIRKSRRTENALLLGCDESKLECLHENKRVTEIKKRKREKCKETCYASLRY